MSGSPLIAPLRGRGLRRPWLVWWALLFGLVLALINTMLFSIAGIEA